LERLKDYPEFLEKVEEIGIMPFSGLIDGWPSLHDYTIPENWFTGDPEIDPWLWKNRAPQEKKLAFGNILGGHKGFVSSRLYPVFYTAFHPGESIQEQWEAGLISLTSRKLGQLFEENGQFTTSGIRRALGVTLKNGGRQLDAAIKELQSAFYITVDGSTLKVDKEGRPYGWHENIYSRVLDWAPADWRVTESGLRRDAARLEILYTVLAINEKLDRTRLTRKLRI
jgi:hypothetical protein